MPWECPTGCNLKEYGVFRDEFREDTIIHFYKVDDGNLENEINHKVYVNDESKYGSVQCANCEEEVTWKS